jgi:uncharacterized protein YndB with AHSA1/START domain
MHEQGAMMREGTGETTVAVSRAVAFTYLVNPRHAPEWFAGVQFAEEPEGSPRQGMSWRFVQVRSGHRIVPVRMEVYEPPSRFVWRTTLRWPRTNLLWEMRCEPEGAGPNAEITRLRMTIGIEAGPMGRLALWLSKPAFRPDPAMQAQRAVERARDALLAETPVESAKRSPARKSPEKRGRRR